MDIFTDIDMQHPETSMSIYTDAFNAHRLVVSQVLYGPRGGRRMQHLELDYDSAVWLHRMLELAMGGDHNE